MKDLYLTSTFTNPWNVTFNAKIGEALEDKGLLCYLPHRDTNQKTGTGDEKFEQDILGINNASIIDASEAIPITARYIHPSGSTTTLIASRKITVIANSQLFSRFFLKI
jgi:hypothetical protein